MRFADWTYKIPESEIRRLLRYNVKYYYAGGKPGVLPTEIIAKILIKIGNDQIKKIEDGSEQEVADDYNYGVTAGTDFFRKTLAERLRREGIDTDWEQLMITTGSQQAIYLILDTLIDPGDVIITTRPAYLGFLGPAGKLEANIVTVPTDLDGIVPEYVESAIALSEKEFGKKPKMIYLVPDGDNPKGTNLPAKRRQALFDIAEAQDILIAEDSPYRNIHFKGEKVFPIKSLDKENQRVIYMGSTTKEAIAARVGYALAPEELRENMIKAKGFFDLCTPLIMQRILDEYYRNYIDNMLPKINSTYETRAKAMIEAMDATFPAGERTDPKGGFFIWWESENKNFNAREFLERVAMPNEVLFVPGEAFYPLGGMAYLPDSNSLQPTIAETHELRLSYSFKDEENIREGIPILGKLLTEELG
jgi:DNA-binding transcriptional MocR family regulator